MPEISVVIPVLNEGDYLRRTIDQLHQTVPPGTEIIVVDDGATDGCCDFLRRGEAPDVKLLDHPEGRLGAAGARNFGAAVAQGDVLVFIDAHVGLTPGWIEKLRDAVNIPGVGAAGPGIAMLGRQDCCGWGFRYHDAAFNIQWLGAPTQDSSEVAMLCAACMAMRRSLFEQLGGFDAGLIRWGSEDAELSMRIWMAGYELRILPDVIIEHLFREKHPYQIDFATVIHNQLRLGFIHLGSARLARVIERLKQFGDFAAACAMLAASDVHQRRALVLANRKYDDDQYFARFGDIY